MILDAEDFLVAESVAVLLQVWPQLTSKFLKNLTTSAAMSSSFVAFGLPMENP